MFTMVNFSQLVLRFPKVQLVDLRHNPLDCEVTITLVKVLLSSCSSVEYTDPISSTDFISTTSTYHSSVTIPNFIFSLTTIPSVPAFTTRSDNSYIGVCFTLLFSFFIVLILCMVRIRVKKYRRCHFNGELDQFANPSWSSSSEETIFEQETTL